MMQKMEQCPLCKREEFREVLYEDNKVWITFCNTCNKPGERKHLLAVFKMHLAEVSEENKRYMMDRVKQIWWKPGEFDFNMKQIKNHYHFHYRTKE